MHRCDNGSCLLLHGTCEIGVHHVVPNHGLQERRGIETPDDTSLDEILFRPSDQQM